MSSPLIDRPTPKSRLLQSLGSKVEGESGPAAVTHREREWLALLPMGVVVLNANGIVIDANPLAVDMLGTPLLFQSWRDIIARSFAPQMDDGMEISLRDGRRVKLTTRALANGEGQLIVLADLTESRRAQAQVAQRERLAAMGEMIATLVHQLRTPLSSALLLAHQLQTPASTLTSRESSANHLLERLHYMERQISDLLLVAGGGAALVEQVSLASLLKSIVAEHRERLAANGVTLSFEGEQLRAQIYGNPDALRGAISNLIENAEQALNAAECKMPCIQLRLRRQGDHLELCVSDNGKGMTESVRARALEPFFTTRKRGTGLGLAVVHAVVQSHQGQMQIFSTPGQGSQFLLRFPLIRQERSSASTLCSDKNEVAA